MIINRKGQGLTEYGIILLLVCSVGLLVYFHFGIKDNLQAVYSNIEANLEDIVGFDTGKTVTVPVYNTTIQKNDDVVFHETKLSFGGTIYWYENAAGKQYTTSQNIKALTYINRYNSKYPNQNTYFKGDNGNYYVMSSNGSNLRRYTGDTSFMNGAEWIQQ